MKAFWALVAKDLKLVLVRPGTYVFVALFAASAGALTFYPGRFFDAGRADLSTLFGVLPWLLAVFTPALAMDGLSAERRTGMDEVLHALPVQPVIIVLAKWLVLWLVCLAGLILTMTLWASVSWLGHPDQAAIAIGYLGAALMAAAYCALSLAASARSTHPVLAFLVALAINMALTAGALPLFDNMPGPLARFLAGFSVPMHQMHFVRGVLSLTDTGFFVLLASFGIYAATVLWLKKKGALVRLSSAVLVMLALNALLSTAPLRSLRLDMTAARLYTLSPAARAVIAAHKAPVHWQFYYSRALAAHYPDIRSYGARVEETLRSFAAASGGRIALRIIDPGVDTPREDAALAAGMQALPTDRNQPLYFGLAQNGRSVISRFDPARAPLLVYDLAATLDAGAASRAPVVLYDGTDLAGKDWFVTGRKQSTLFRRLGERYRVILLTDTFAPADLDGAIVMLVHPPRFGPAQQSALASFAAKGGRMLVFLDPYSEVSARPGLDGLPRAGARMASSAPDFLAKSGLAWSSTQIVLDRDAAMPAQVSEDGKTRTARQPAWIGVLPARLSAQVPFSAGLQRGLVLASAAALQAKRTSGWRKLAWSSANAALLPVSTYAAGASADGLMTAPASDGVKHWLGAIKGGVMVIGDADLLDDSFYVKSDPVFGPREKADNADLVLGALDWLAGSDMLLKLRARTTPLRRLTRIDALRTRAARQYRQAEADAGSNPDEQAKRALRAVRQRFHHQIRARERALEIINIWLGPLGLIALGAGFTLWRRRKRRG